MALPNMVEEYLQRHHMPITQHHHGPVYTAHQLALIEHLPDAEVAKVVFLMCDEEMVMAMLPADHNLNLHLARTEMGAREIRLATEHEIAQRVNTLQPGAIPPFGSIFGLKVYMDEALMAHDMVEVPGGVHTDSIRLWIDDYMDEEEPKIVKLSRGLVHRKKPSSRNRPYFF